MEQQKGDLRKMMKHALERVSKLPAIGHFNHIRIEARHTNPI